VLDPAQSKGPLSTRMRWALGSFDVIAAVLAFLFSVFIVIGASFRATDSTAWFSSSLGAAAGSAIAILALGVVLYIPISLLYRWLDRQWSGERSATARLIPMRRAVRRWLLPTFVALLAGWLPWLLIHYPGDVDSDTTNQMFQWLGLRPRDDHHPWFDTVVFGWFWDIGAAVGDYKIGMFIYMLIQVAATALGMALVLTYLGRLGLADMPRRILTAVAAVFPIFAITVSLMTKDNLAGIFWLPFLVLFVETVRTRGAILCRPWVGLVAIALIVPLVLARRPNVYVFGLCTLVVLFIVTGRARKRLLAGTASILLITSLVWPRIVLPAAGVTPGTINDMLSVPLQQTARTVLLHGDELPDSERNAIDTMLRYGTLADAYTPRKSDAVKARWNNDATTAQKLAYARVWLAQLTRYPGTYISATANNTFPYFTPGQPVDYPRELSNQRRYTDGLLKRSVEGTTRQQVEQVVNSLYQLPALTSTRTAVNRATRAFISTNVLASTAFFASWLPLLALGFAIRRRNWMLAITTAPFFINLLILIAGPAVLGRYLLPMVLGSVLLAGLMLVPVRWVPHQPTPHQARPEAEQGAPVAQAHQS
jgi:Family of unknown function (DUF6020)